MDIVKLEMVNKYINSLSLTEKNNTQFIKYINNINSYIVQNKIVLNSNEIIELLDCNEVLKDCVESLEYHGEDIFILLLKDCLKILIEENKQIQKVININIYKVDKNDNIFNYVKDIPILSDNIQKRLLRKAQNNDKIAREVLVKTNLRMIHSIAYKYCNKGLDFDDLVQEGSMGILESIKKYDLSQGGNIKFSSYAFRMICSRMISAIYKKGKSIKLPVYIQQKLILLNRTIDNFKKEFGRFPTLEETAQIMNLTEEEVIKILKNKNKYSFLTEDIYDERSKINDKEQQEISVQKNDVLETIIKIMLPRDIELLLKKCKLNEKEKEYLKLRYGFYDNKLHSYAELARFYNISIEGLRHREISILRKIICSDIIYDFINYMDNSNQAKNNIDFLRQEYKNIKNRSISIGKLLDKHLQKKI